MTQRISRAREPWEPFDGVVLAVVAVRLAEPWIRIPSAAPSLISNHRVQLGMGAALIVNAAVAWRLVARKRRLRLPIYPRRWFGWQLAYGMVFELGLAVILPRGDFVGHRISAVGWQLSIGDLLSMQLFLGCCLIGLRYGFAAVPFLVAGIPAWALACMALNGRVEVGFAGNWALWTFIDSMAGAFGGGVLNEMTNTGRVAMEDVKRLAFEAGTTTAFERRAERHEDQDFHLVEALGIEFRELDELIQRVGEGQPRITRIWNEVNQREAKRTLDEALGELANRCESLDIKADVLKHGVSWSAPFDAVEESYAQHFVYVVGANMTANVGVLIVVDVDERWIRLRAVLFGGTVRNVPSDDLYHSVETLEKLSKVLGGSLLMTRVDGLGEVVEGRIQRLTHTVSFSESDEQAL